MMADASVFTGYSELGLITYGLLLLFAKAILILFTAQLLAEQLEFSSASVRHTIWLLAIASMAALPLLTVLLPEWRIIPIDLAPANAAESPAYVLSGQAVSSANTFSWLDGVGMVYLLVVTLGLLRLFSSLVRIGSLTARSDAAEALWYELASASGSRSVTIRKSAHISGPMTWGTLRPVILLPIDAERWSAQDQAMIIRHEMTHVMRADWLTQLVAQLVAVLYWPVPGVRKALKNLSLEAERACDNQVLMNGASQADYAALLVRQARTTSIPSAVALGSASELAQRVRDIVNNYIDRSGEYKTQWLLAFIATGLLLPLATVKVNGQHTEELPMFSLRTIKVVSPESQPEIPSNSIAIPIQRPQRASEAVPEPGYAELLRSTVSEVSLQLSVTPAPINPIVSEALMMTNPDTPAIRLLEQIAPEYPETARRKGIEGNVLVEFDINASGRVVNPRVVHSEPGGYFNRAVMTALQAYRFEPARVGGTDMVLTGLQKQFYFQLREDAPSAQRTLPAPVPDPVDVIDSG